MVTDGTLEELGGTSLSSLNSSISDSQRKLQVVKISLVETFVLGKLSVEFVTFSNTGGPSVEFRLTSNPSDAFIKKIRTSLDEFTGLKKISEV